MEEYFVKRFVKEDGLPKETDIYITNEDLHTRFDADNGTWRLDGDREIEWWLEPYDRVKELEETILDQNKEIENLKRIVKQKTPRRLVDEG